MGLLLCDIILLRDIFTGQPVLCGIVDGVIRGISHQFTDADRLSSDRQPLIP
jgi:hypothetical protein